MKDWALCLYVLPSHINKQKSFTTAATSTVSVLQHSVYFLTSIFWGEKAIFLVIFWECFCKESKYFPNNNSTKHAFNHMTTVTICHIQHQEGNILIYIIYILTIATPCLSARIKNTKRVERITDINGAIAGTQKNFGFFFPWCISIYNTIMRK